MNGKHKFFAGEFSRSGMGGREILNLYAAAVMRMPEPPGIPPLFRGIFKNAYLPTAISAMTARLSSGTKKNAATCAPASTRSTSTSTA